MKHESLITLGLTHTEADLYLSLLKLKAGSAIQISDAAGVAKSTAYDALKSLVRRGLVNTYKKRGRKQFSANDPALLREHIKRQEGALEGVLPELSALYAAGSSGTSARLYKGRDGVSLVTEEILSEAHELIGIGSPEDIFEKLPDFLPDFTARRKKRGIPFRGIFRDSPKARERKALDAEDLRTSRLVAPPFPFSSLLYLWKNKIAMITERDDISVVVIEEQELQQMIRAVFELLWEKTPG